MINNPNSPENLLGVWFKEMDEFMFNGAVEDSEISEYRDAMAAHIFDFADTHGKLLEMLHWLDTKEAQAVFESAEHSMAVYQVIEWLLSRRDFDDWSDIEQTQDFQGLIRDWIEDHNLPLPAQLQLR